MLTLHDKVLGDKPWLVTRQPDPAPLPPHIPDDAIEEGSFWYWIMKSGQEKPYVMCTGGTSAPYQATGYWPDVIYERMKQLDPTLQ